jgi:flagellar assembly protein FliH
MPVVKAKQADRQHQSAIVMDLSDLERQAARILADARAEATRILADARVQATAEAAQIKEQAKKAGHDEGFAAGEAKGHQSGHDEAVKSVTAALQDLTARWAQTLDIFEQNLPTHVADAKADVIRLALAVAAHVTRLEAVRNKRVVEATVAEALSLVGAGRNVAVHVHPDEFAAMEDYLPDLLAKMRTVSAVELKPDETIPMGGCELHFGAGAVDARLDTQLDRIAAELLAGDAAPEPPAGAEGADSAGGPT